MVLCDLLTGGILQNLYPTRSKNRKAKFKREFGKYHLLKVSVKNYKEDTWNEIKKLPTAKRLAMKVIVGYWHMPESAKYKQYKIVKQKKKSRS